MLDRLGPLELYFCGLAMAGAVSLPLSGVLGLLLVSALPRVLGDCPSPDFGAHPDNPAQVGFGATEPRRRPPPKDQRERARAGALPLGALYTAAVVAFVLYKCLQQGEDEAAVLQKESGKKEPLQSEQQLAQLTQQLAQTEQHLNNLMAQLDPLFERVTTLAGAQKELLNMKLQTIHQLLQDSKPDKGVEVPEPEAPRPFPEDLCIEEEESEEEEEEEEEEEGTVVAAGDSLAWEEPLNWGTKTWNLSTAWEVEQGLRKRCSKAAAECLSHSLNQEGGTTAEGLVKPSLFL